MKKEKIIANISVVVGLSLITLSAFSCLFRWFPVSQSYLITDIGIITFGFIGLPYCFKNFSIKNGKVIGYIISFIGLSVVVFAWLSGNIIYGTLSHILLWDAGFLLALLGLTIRQVKK